MAVVKKCPKIKLSNIFFLLMGVAFGSVLTDNLLRQKAAEPFVRFAVWEQLAFQVEARLLTPDEYADAEEIAMIEWGGPPSDLRPRLVKALREAQYRESEEERLEIIRTRHPRRRCARVVGPAKATTKIPLINIEQISKLHLRPLCDRHEARRRTAGEICL